MAEEKDSSESLFSGKWFAGALFLVLTLAAWMAFYVIYGESGKLDVAETTVVALMLALVVFGGRALVLRWRNKPTKHAARRS
jgi:predicted permease